MYFLSSDVLRGYQNLLFNSFGTFSTDRYWGHLDSFISTSVPLKTHKDIQYLFHCRRVGQIFEVYGTQLPKIIFYCSNVTLLSWTDNFNECNRVLTYETNGCLYLSINFVTLNDWDFTCKFSYFFFFSFNFSLSLSLKILNLFQTIVL